jgi:hypothetical protein
MGPEIIRSEGTETSKIAWNGFGTFIPTALGPSIVEPKITQLVSYSSGKMTERVKQHGENDKMLVRLNHTSVSSYP